jgi:transposase
MIISEDRIEKLESENQIFRVQVQGLETQIQALIKENAELKERLGLNSKNSSIPSSKELYKIKKENRLKSSRKIGGQVGHKGFFRERLPADEVIKIDLPISCECGGELAIAKEAYIHQKIDLPEIKPHVTEYHLAHGRCRKCGRRRSSTLPTGVDRDVFGTRTKAVIAALTGFYKNSKKEVVGILADIFNLKISSASITNSEAKVAVKCQETYAAIEQEVANSNIVHMDETSHYNKGKLGWCWMFSSDKASFLKLTDSRGKKVLENSVFGSNDQLVVTDRYAAYNYFAEENRQVCWAHLSRDFERLAHSFQPEVKVMGSYLKNVASELFALKKALTTNDIDALRFLRRARKLRKRTWRYLQEIAYVLQAVHAARVAKNMMKSENMMWKFLDDPINIPLTNNHAERQIRHYVVYRKNSYFTQSETGNKFLERIISLYLTAKQQNQNPFQQLLTCLD